MNTRTSYSFSAQAVMNYPRISVVFPLRGGGGSGQSSPTSTLRRTPAPAGLPRVLDVGGAWTSE